MKFYFAHSKYWARLNVLHFQLSISQTLRDRTPRPILNHEGAPTSSATPPLQCTKNKYIANLISHEYRTCLCWFIYWGGGGGAGGGRSGRRKGRNTTTKIRNIACTVIPYWTTPRSYLASSVTLQKESTELIYCFTSNDAVLLVILLLLFRDNWRAISSVQLFLYAPVTACLII